MVSLRDSLTYISPELMEVLLPFVLIFTAIYAISSQIPHMSDETKKSHKKMRIVLALVISLLVVIPHVTGQYYYGNVDVVDVINQSIPQVAMIIIAVIMVLLLIASTNSSKNQLDAKYFPVRWIALVLVILIFLDNMNYSFFSDIPLLSWFSDPEFQALLLVILVFGLIVAFITWGGDNANTAGTTSVTKTTKTNE